ncbi:MAG: T9SS type A sorting domain-containing protein [Bacteroidota bacterium]|nr:T9SS type A sorting domain-containing protein [Bacteroidota bacterium]MDX5430554.1 T9SS type A sorting domain-containing protein [Bacteroidota bacterium]MDX5469306.1 T9SS type A sorting domain-containing protein [Bacteroidota bacterium]
MRFLLAFLVFLSISFRCYSQYAPRDNWAGTTAIPKDSALFVDWANQGMIYRGWQDIRDTSIGRVSGGLPTMAFSYANGEAVSLGDGGSMVLEFDVPIVDGPGYDFAVFENGFHIRNQGDSDFLELAFVEVSEDGQNWVRFPSLSDNDTLVQLGTYSGMKASRVHNLAEKYVAGYGTPFDLNELQDSGLNLMNIRYVRIVDVVGSLEDGIASRDGRGHKINDPFPTAFAQGGFDLDGVGVIHNLHAPNGLSEMRRFRPFPNPSRAGQGIRLSEVQEVSYQIYTITGYLLEEGLGLEAGKKLSPGLYILHVSGPQPQNIRWIVQE